MSILQGKVWFLIMIWKNDFMLEELVRVEGTMLSD